MPKLIIKQSNSAASQQSSMATWLSIGGLLILLATVAAGAFFFYKTPLPGSELEPLAFSSATNDSATTSYQSLHAVLGDLMTEYEGLAARGADDYQKNLLLQGKAESILGHLDKMDTASKQLGLNAKEAGEVTDRHQFYKDFWQAKLHFRELRISRFENKKAVPNDQHDQAAALQKTITQEENKGAEDIADKAVPDETIVSQEQVADVTVVEEQVQKKPKFQFAKPPEGMEMPAGFCDLSNPENSCKPEAGAMAGSDLPALDELPLPEDLADLPALDELPLPDELALPEDLPPLPDEELPPLPDDNVAVVNDSQPKKPKFQFAKPPKGMEMPAGFCDLTNPESSCKPEADAMVESGLPALDDLPLPEDLADLPVLDDLPLPDELALPEDLPPLPDEGLPPLPGDNVALVNDDQPKKPKFQFAKPPEGMELPAGFCDLSDPAQSCKPETGVGGSMAGSDLPALDDLSLPELPPLGDLPPLPEGGLLSDVDQPVLNESETAVAVDQNKL